MDFIPINSIEEIDPRKISIRDINKRYIDRQGNRYATRFNLETRRIEVVRIAQSKEEAIRISQQIRQENRDDRRPGRSDDGPAQPAASAPASAQVEGDIPEFDDLTAMEPENLSSGGVKAPSAGAGPEFQSGVFIENHLLEEIVQHLGRTKERQQVILNNLKNSRAFEGQNAVPLSELQREIDIDCWQATEEAINYQRELYGYPRSVSQYIMRLPPDEKAKAEAAPDEQTRMEMIRRWETRRAFEKLYVKISDLTLQMQSILTDVSSDTASQLMAAQRQQLEDAEASIQILQDEVQQKLHQINLWKRRYP